jgi:xanthosine utilization system XapX-like protein
MRTLLIALVCGLLVGCEYSVPLVPAPESEIDDSVLGLWQTSSGGQTQQLLVLPLDRKEYLVSYPSNSTNAMFARACLGGVGGKTLIQLKWFGTAQAGLPDNNRVFQFVTYSTTGDNLTVRLLNSEVVKKDASSTVELARAIAANADKTNLFGEAMAFTKVKK